MAAGEADEHWATSPDRVQSLERGLAVIRAFGAERPCMTLSQVATAANVSRAAARRLLKTLQVIGYIECDDGKHFALRPAVLDLGFAYLASQPWSREAQNQISRLAGRLGHSCAVGVLDGFDVVYVAYASPKPGASLDRSVGTRLPTHATAVGRVILAGLPDAKAKALLRRQPLRSFSPFTETDVDRLTANLAPIRQEGFCLIDQAHRIGLRSLSVPIKDRTGRGHAGLSMSYGLTDGPYEKAALPHLFAAATEIGMAIASPE